MSESINASTATSSQSDPIEALWRFFSSTKLALILILVIAAISFLGSLFPQASGTLLTNSQEYSRWLDTLRPTYGGLTDFYSALGFYNVYAVWWFKTLLMVLVFNTIICTLNRLPSILQSIRTPKIRMEESFFKSARHRASFKHRGGPGGSRLVAESLVQILSGKKYKVHVDEEGDTKYFFADRFSIFKLGTLVSHTSIVVLLIGTVLGTMFGFVDEQGIVPEGGTYQVPFGENFSVRADLFRAEYYPDGRPKDYYSDLAVIDGGKEVVKQRIRVNEPLEYHGVRFHQAFFGPVATVDVKSSSGQSLYSGDLPLPNSSGPSSVGFTPLAGTDLFLVVALPEGGGNQLNVQLMRGDAVVAKGLLKSGDSQSVGGYQMAFKGTKQFTGLRVVKDPGVPIVWLASAMLVIGVCVTLYFPRRRLWGRIKAGEVALAGTADRMVNFQEELNRLVDEVRATDAPGGESSRKRGG